MRLWQAGGAGSEQDRGSLLGGETRHQDRFRSMGQYRRVAEHRRRNRLRRVGQAIDIVIDCKGGRQQARRLGRWQQGDLATAKRCGKADGEPVAVLTQIGDVAMIWQQNGQRRHITQVIFDGNILTAATGERSRRVRHAQQRDFNHAAEAPAAQPMRPRFAA